MADEAKNVENTGKTEKPEAMEKSQSAATVDWVTRRASCSLPKIFKELRSEVEADMKIRNGLRPNNSPYEFSVVESGADFSAVLAAKIAENDVRRSVTFNLAEHAILVRDEEGKQMLEVTLSFNDKGECKLYVNEEEREMWQVRRMALEELLFKGY